eukprot:6519474-Alexandrium_andersonii.AAC.1
MGPLAARRLWASLFRFHRHAVRGLLQSPRWASGPKALPGPPPPVRPPEGPAPPAEHGQVRLG